MEAVLGILLELIERIINEEEGKDVKGDEFDKPCNTNKPNITHR